MSDQIKDDIVQWIKDFVEVPHPVWGGLPPCPYARAARVDNDIKIVVQETEDYYALIEQHIDQFINSNVHVVLVVAKDAATIDSDEYTNYISNRNKHLIQNSLYLLTDHPAISEFNNGVSVQQGKYVITFIQNINNLKSASKDLHENTTYYDSWSEEFYNEVVVKRDRLWEKYKNGPKV